MSSHQPQHPADGDDAQSREEFLDEFREPEHRTIQADGPKRQWTDARSIREEHGIPAYDGEAFNYQNLVPDIVEKTWEPEPGETGGGTDLLAVGKPGSGKSTFANHLALRELEVPGSKLVWRASTSRSEWLPLAPWTTLCLPSSTDYQARFVPRDPSEREYVLSLEELQEYVVRDIVRYDSPHHLNHELLNPAQVHVVYPDPRMRGCQDAYERAPEKQYEPPSDDRPLFHEDDPTTHWWFAWILSRVESGPNDWTTLVLDEIGDIAPDVARSDEYGTYQKVELLRDAWVDARKKGLSIYAFGHAERDIHDMIRHKIRWRMTMNGTSNPTAKGEVVGFGRVPMHSDQASRMNIGRGLIWNEQNFERVAWKNYSAPVSHKLKLERVG